MSKFVESEGFLLLMNPAAINGGYGLGNEVSPLGERTWWELPFASDVAGCPPIVEAILKAIEARRNCGHLVGLHHMSDILSPLPDQAFAAIAAHSRYHCRFARLRRPRATTQPVAGRFLSGFRGHIAAINMTSSHKWRLLETTLLVLTSLSSQHTYEQVYRF